jgi:AraC-like DNA-binding protein
MLTFARTRGVDIEAILTAIGMSTSALDEYDRRIPEASRCRAWIEAASRTQDPSFGLHVAEHSRIGAYDVLDHSLYFSTTLYEALDRIVRFHRVLCDAWAIHREVAAGIARVRRIEQTPSHEVEAAFAFLVLRARELTGLPLAPHEVRFTHPAPPDTSSHAALFRAPVRFGCATSELVFAANDLTLPIKTANPDVLHVLDRYMTDLLARLPKDSSFVERVRAVIRQTLRGGRPTLRSTARALHASPRTVQRRLDEHGTSHMEILQAVRRELAERLVEEGRMSVTEIAFLLGFTDVSGFRRMQKRWMGVTVSQAGPSG